MRRGYLALVGAAVAGGVLLVGGSAQSQTPTLSVLARDNSFQLAAGGAVNATIAAGESVMFSQSGSNPHNVVFKSTQPACVQTSGTSSGAVPPLPRDATSSAWSGTCTFTAPATYTFYCAFHGEGMSGSIAVPSVAPPPPPPPISPPPPPPPVSLPPPPPLPPTTLAATSLRVTTPQSSFTLRGSVNVSRASSRLLARAFARRGALSGGRSTLLVQVGRQLRSSVGPGRVSFSLPLTATGRRALRRNGRLAITFRLTVDPTTGTTYTAKRTVILRAP